jgi:hypothetical protein
MPSVYIETYGCQMNVSDSELMYGKLAAEGYTTQDTPHGADVVLVNTCAIRENAEQRVIGRLGELRRDLKAGAVLGVTGCMAQRLGPRLLETDTRVQLVVGPDAYRMLPALIENAKKGERFTATDFDLEEHYEDFTARRFEGVKAWIPVQRGCDYRCTYCIVPTTRGPERSRKLADVVRETGEVVAQGITEVVLLGQTVNSYTTARTTSPTCCARWAPCPASVACATRARTRTTFRPRDRRDGRDARGLRTRASADAERLHVDAQAHAAPLLARGVSRRGRTAARGDPRARAHHRHHRRFPRRDRRGVRGHALALSRGALRRRLHVQVLRARRHARHAHAGRVDHPRGGRR